MTRIMPVCTLYFFRGRHAELDLLLNIADNVEYGGVGV